MLNQQLSPRCPSPLLPILPITGVCSCRSYKIVRLNHPRASGIIPERLRAYSLFTELRPVSPTAADLSRLDLPVIVRFPPLAIPHPCPLCVTEPRGEERRPRGDAERLPSRATPLTPGPRRLLARVCRRAPN